MITAPPPIMNSYGANPQQSSIAAWLLRHPQFGPMQGITDPAPQPFIPPGQGQGLQTAPGQQSAPGLQFHPGHNIAQLLMRLPHQGARYMQRPEEFWNVRNGY